MSRVKLSDIATVTAGNVAPKAKDFTTDGVPFVRAGSLSGLLETGDFSQLETIDSTAASRLRLKLFPAGTVVFAKSGMSCLKGYVYTLPRECYVVSHLACVTPKEGYSQYLKHYFRYWKPNRLIENPSFPSIKLSKISDIELDLPDGDRAQEIVDNLEAALDAIDTEQLQLNKLDELVKSRFVEMFERGQDWDFRTLAECCATPDDIKCGPFGSQLHKEDYISEGVPVWGIPEVNSGFEQMPDKYVSPENGQRLQSYSLVPGDVAMNRKGNVGQAALFDGSKPSGIIHSDVLRVRVNQDVLDPAFLVEQLHSSHVVREQVMSASTGAIMAGTNVTKLKKIKVFVPPLALQQEFAAFVQQVDKLKFETQQAIEKLQLLYDSLAQEYFGS